MYKWQNEENTIIENIETRQSIPIQHRFYADVEQWVSEGNTIAPWKTAEEIAEGIMTDKIARYRTAVGAHIDATAQALGFDSILTAVTYADEGADARNQAYGLVLRIWRSNCWEHSRGVLSAWLAGGDEPSIDELLAGLPEFIAPQLP